MVYDYGRYYFTILHLFSAVVASGLWVAPGDSEEVAAALSQALRNCIERFVFNYFLDPESNLNMFISCPAILESTEH